MIVITALLATWLATIIIFYRSHDWQERYAFPPEQQIAALADSLERASSSEQKSLILRVATSSTLTARLEEGHAFLATPGKHAEVNDALRQSYAALLGDRAFSITQVHAHPAGWPFRWLSRRKMLEFAIALRTGDTLVVDATSALPVTRFGLPVGFGAGLVGTLIALIALLTMHREMRPLLRLAAAVDEIDLSGTPQLLPFAQTRAPEIEALIAAFNRLQGRLTQLLHARMAMLGGISHDVRTFATKLRLRVDRIPEGPERERAISDIADMIHLLDDALLASRAGAHELAEELLAFDELVRSEVEDRRAAGATIFLHIGESAIGATVIGDRVALRRIIANLVDNALHYGHVAYLILDTDAQTLVMTVDDEGTGIAPDMREALLEPFVRLETSRNRRTGGAGLGLSIARNLVEAHGGTLAIDDALAGGARLIVRLPLFALS